jgi:hypothetical protein
MKINKITLIESKSEGLSVHLAARIAENGDLILEGYDIGQFVEDRFGKSDYEFSLKIQAEYKDTILLKLIGEKFANDAEFKAWLDEKQIPSDFWSF